MQLVCIKELELNKHVRLSTLVARIMSESIAKLSSDNVTDIVRLIMDMGVHDCINEFLYWFSFNVNPKETTVSPAFLGKLMEVIGKSARLIAMSILRVHAGDTTMVLKQVRPSAS